ncbi:DUF397 domain-containing protein [Streptomyces sp. NPDC020379]|uniref:DUF397 domain-containing protein n=1 Tax=Streptomyces sp. NPDC020379 TaxID=3365071 RepID=UPI0037A71836
MEAALGIPDCVPIRDSKNPTGPMLAMPPTAWTSFVTWTKSSHSDDDHGNCIEAALAIPDCVPIRDSKNPTGPVLALSPTAWAAFVTAVRRQQL